MTKQRMITSENELEEMLRGTLLDNRVVRKQWTGYGESALSLQLKRGCEYEELLTLWSLKEQIGRHAFFLNESWASHFSCVEPPEGSYDEECGFKEMRRESLGVDADAYLSSGGEFNECSPTRTTELFNWLDQPLDDEVHPLTKTRSRFGESPSVQEMRDLWKNGTLRSDADMEHWLLNWELERFGRFALENQIPEISYTYPMSVPCTVFLPPTVQSTEAVLYTAWAGFNDQGSIKLAAVRLWEKRYGVQLVSSFLTNLHFKVKRRPSSPDEAFKLAIAHYHFASLSINMPAVSLRDYARMLLAADHWEIVTYA